ncbi:alpha/beta hydrolase [Paenarthrobacter sp. NPDC090520]|uniref:alpha/beta hydrolase n=1 Tax=Paenarthrobacter sp. NPDC090520 TaxID=3364382 RepID=UPI00382E6C12
MPVTKASTSRAPLLVWISIVCASALIVVPAAMLLGNPVVLRGHPALPVLLLVAAAGGLLWGFLLWRGRGSRPKRSMLRSIGAWVGRLLALSAVAALAWLNPFAHQPAGPQPARNVAIVESPTDIAMAPVNSTPSKGLVFYPGARVEAKAYEDVLGPVANAGYLVVILKEPLGLSLLDGSQARAAMSAHPEVHSWAVGGHSLGGVSASSFALDNPDVKGLVLFASYPLDSLRDRAGLSVLSVSGTADGLSTPAKIDLSRELLPLDTTFVTVQGGNHAYFGSYGAQPGDGEASIDRTAAQEQISTATVTSMGQLAGG